MCQPQTRQNYFVLQAFANATKPIGREELVHLADEVAKQNGYNSLVETGPHSLGRIVTSAARGKAITRNARGEFSLTDEGRFQLNILRNLVNKSNSRKDFPAPTAA